MKDFRFLIFFLLFFVLGCKKDMEPIGITDPCQIDLSFTINFQFPIISHPKVNPTNSRELAFIREKFFTICCDQELIVLDLETKAMKSIFIGQISSFDWSAKNWLIFTDDSSSEIYKIKPSGDSLTLLTDYGFGFSPKWSSTGNEFLYTYSSPQYDSNHLRILTDQGMVAKELSFNYPFIAWQNDSILVAENGDLILGSTTITFYSMKDSITQFPSLISRAVLENAGSFRAMDWISADSMVVACELGIFLVDFSDLIMPKPLKIRSNCTHGGYGKVTFDHQARQLILERYDYEITGEKEAIRNIRFVRMNLDGTGEEVIEIPGL